MCVSLTCNPRSRSGGQQTNLPLRASQCHFARLARRSMNKSSGKLRLHGSRPTFPRQNAAARPHSASHHVHHHTLTHHDLLVARPPNTTHSGSLQYIHSQRTSHQPGKTSSLSRVCNMVPFPRLDPRLLTLPVDPEANSQETAVPKRSTGTAVPRCSGCAPKSDHLPLLDPPFLALHPEYSDISHNVETCSTAYHSLVHTLTKSFSPDLLNNRPYVCR